MQLQASIAGEMLGEEGSVLTYGDGVDISCGVYFYGKGFTSLFSD